MKISNSKKVLAKVIHDKGGWIAGNYVTCGGNSGCCVFTEGRPEYEVSNHAWEVEASQLRGSVESDKIPNWHQTILSKDEYLHLYPITDDSKPECRKSVVVNIPEQADKPTIEQLAADYRNKLDYANRKQKEADDAKAAADAALGELELAGEEIGLIVAVAKRDHVSVVSLDCLMIGDVVVSGVVRGVDGYNAQECTVISLHPDKGGSVIRAAFSDGSIWFVDDWVFARRP